MLNYPIVTIVGSPNSGKSTLYNLLTKTNKSLVNNIPGFTRDRNYGYVKINKYQFICIDTGSIINNIQKKKIKLINFSVNEQTFQAIKEADLILFIIKGLYLTSTDYEIINKIRLYKKKVIIILNRKHSNFYEKEFYSLGYRLLNINLTDINYINKLSILLLPYIKDIYFKKKITKNINFKFFNDIKNNNITLSIIGIPNVGKSTLINKILQEERMIVNDISGTTRDSISIPITNTNSIVAKYFRNLIIVDNAGIKKKSKVKNKEKNIIKNSFKSIKKSNIILFIIDGSKETFFSQETIIVNYIINQGKPIIIAINKYDLINIKKIKQIKEIIKIKFPFIPIIFISAKYGVGLKNLFKFLFKVYNLTNQKIKTSKLMKIMYLAVNNFPPPMIKKHRIKLKYIHVGKYNPLTLIIHGNQVTKLENNYKRYLSNFLYKNLKLFGIPIFLKFKENKNPYNKNYIN
ncbi:ribosome biogenesis GTPase Der [Enterobacteriaceae endosymbiont of Plateumaris consimilis]|uniref:ribosome biogenesis GTPase Der n=1 Tax=Enterobacteriaceae endosymbiont of Plateumaris consimilis TaxID=2675794 RepID=UPI0014498D56|nr:ribosome biogenesis GTPase Der [Enterobacteriaceae endosymbiont of Plateumaris consimilis]QJC28461.1 ribosome biogenesis GTPase Der [Enterobacteriaceae endosymbiont of Plateumaris consimilis]